MSDHARRLVGIEALNEGSERWTGEGELVAVIDSGIDATHPDLHDRVESFEVVGGAMATDQVGHGTHVSGTIAGTGKASKKEVRGMAPKAKLVGLGIVKAGGTLCLPIDLGDLLRQVADKGAKIINLSWGTAVGSVYENGSMAIDTFARERPDVLVVVAAGNSGIAPEGYPAFYSIGSPATAKNVLTVGACASDRKEFADVTWGGFKATSFPAAPTRDDTVVGEPNRPAALSSRGPTDSEAVKPDVIAPGTAILAPRASEAPEANFWRPCPKFENRYGFMVGTSMATPVVSGAAAVLRQHLREEHKLSAPSSALLRAILVASACRIPWSREPADERDCGYPDFDQGFGRIDLRTVLPHKDAPKGRKLELIDVAHEDPEALERGAPAEAQRKAAHAYRFTVPAGANEALRIVLAWTDYSVRGIQNLLKLDLVGPGGLRRRGNQEHTWLQPPEKYLDPKFKEMRSDNRNNVQQVVVEDPPAGEYRIRIVAQNTLFPPQGFALCVVSELKGEVEREA